MAGACLDSQRFQITRAGGRQPNLGFQLLAPFPDQTMADQVLWFAPRASTRLSDHIRCYFRLASCRTASQFLDRLAVLIAGAEVHLWIKARGISPQDRFHSTGLVKEVLPRNGGQRSQIGDRTSDALSVVQDGGSGSPRRQIERRLQLGNEPGECGDERLQARQAKHRRKRP